MKGSGAVVVLLALVAAGCGEGGSRAERAESWTTSGDPLLVIGGADEREDYTIHMFAGATRLSDGRIVVANAGTSELRFYDPDGDHLFSAGREGEGPGEFRFIRKIRRLPGDTVLVLSMQPGLSRVAPDGRVVSQERLVTWSLAPACRIGEANWDLLPDGSVFSVFEENRGISGCPPLVDGVSRVSGLVARRPPGEAGLDTFAILPATERNGTDYRVFGHQLLVAIGQDAVYAGDTAADTIVVFGLDGTVRGSLPVPFEAEPVPDSARSETVRRFMRGDQEVIGGRYDYPTELPRMGRLLAGANGQLWVMRYPTDLLGPKASVRLVSPFRPWIPAGGARWAVLERSGRVVARVRTPPAFYPLEVGEDWVLGALYDAMDRVAVVMYGLERAHSVD